MDYPRITRLLKPSILMFLLICVTAIATRSTRSSVSTGTFEPPLRLQLIAGNNSVQSGKPIQITVRFLDRNYQPVRNDGTRIVEFGFALPAGQKALPGTFSPARIEVGPGAPSAATTFTARQLGRVSITARATGLDPAQTIVIVTKPASFISQLLVPFEPVAYAQNDTWDISPQTKLTAQANGVSRVILKLSFQNDAPGEKPARVRVDAPARIIYQDKDWGTEARVKFMDGVTDDINVISKDEQTVTFKAWTSDHDEKMASLKFVAPDATRIRFDENLKEIKSTLDKTPILVRLTDDTLNAVRTKSKIRVTFTPGRNDDPISFEPPFIVFSPDQQQLSQQVWLHLKGLPLGNEFTLQAVADEGLTSESKTIKIESPIKGVSLKGPDEVVRGTSDSNYVVRLTDHDNKPMEADWDRKVTLSADYGRFKPDELIIPKGQHSATVQYISAPTNGKVSLKANSRGLREGGQNVVIITALYWLYLAALAGGLLGSIVRHVRQSEQPDGTRAPFTWRALVGSTLGSLITGLFFYLAMNLGLSRALGAMALPALDYGTWVVAFFFGGIGGFAGPMVFERLVSLVLPAGNVAQPAPSH